MDPAEMDEALSDMESAVPRPPASREEREAHAATIFAEKGNIARLSRIRQFMFGSLDGLLVPLGIVSGVAGGTSNSKIVVIAGVAEAFAGALSMGAGEYLSGQAEAEVHAAKIREELEEIRVMPDVEKYEIEVLFRNEGLSEADARDVADKVTTSNRSWVNTMVEKELGLTTDAEETPLIDSLYMGFSYMAASIVPLAPYFFLPVKWAFPLSLALTIVVLFAIGIIKGRIVRMSLARSALQVVVIGTISALGGYVLGTLLPHLLGGI